MEYKDIPLENDGEYIEAVNHRTFIILATIGEGIAVIILIIAAVKHFKKNVAYEKDGEQPATTVKTNSELRCPYCNTKKTKDASNCPNCGATFR